MESHQQSNVFLSIFPINTILTFMHTFDTFKEACMASGLIEDDHEWRICLKEVIAI